MLSIDDCAESITTRIFSVNFNGPDEMIGTRIAIKTRRQPEEPEVNLGGYSYAAAKDVIRQELVAWVREIKEALECN